jgi:anti-sigma factor ChrR (cupin superfamily)
MVTAVSDREGGMAARLQPQSLIQLVRSHKVDWEPLAEPGVSGVWVKVLRFDEETRRAPTILLKFEAGATYPAHNHPGGEEIFVIEGDVKLGKDRLLAGRLLVHAAAWQACCLVGSRLHPAG